MSWDQFQQILRILLYTGGGYFFGDAVAQSEMYQAAAGGVVAVGAFIWWMVWEKDRPSAK